MARSLPMYVDTSVLSVTLGSSEAAAATQITDSDGRGCAGVLIRGALGNLDSTGGKVTVNIYNGETVDDAIQFYSVELDFTSLTQTSDTQSPGIPVTSKDIYVTMTGDSTANTKDFNCIIYLQKIAVGS